MAGEATALQRQVSFLSLNPDYLGLSASMRMSLETLVTAHSEASRKRREILSPSCPCGAGM